MVTHSSALDWRIPWTEKPDGLQSMGSQKVGYDLVTNTYIWQFYSQFLKSNCLLSNSIWIYNRYPKFNTTDSFCSLNLFFPQPPNFSIQSFRLFSFSGLKPLYVMPHLQSISKSICSTLNYIPEKAMAPHSSILAWKIPWTEEPGGLQSMGSLRVGHD